MIGTAVVICGWAAFWTYKIASLHSLVGALKGDMDSLAPLLARAPTDAFREQVLKTAEEVAWLITNAEHLREEAIRNALVGGAILIAAAVVAVLIARRVDRRRTLTA
ncbi:hypothetical protein [Brevundimonas sp.]|uniref:hypothetical protein n=1 Tax=Brevundimonas sp. TaxID=1871086 RepID=UPI001D96C094|nr:hypothetical protein [Brevundimonas sp.]MBL0947598.1 hypothetical protein [Brevundimonas sp.]